MTKALECFPIHHAGRRAFTHPELGHEGLAQTSVCYLRFLRPVRVTHLELAVVTGGDAGRWIPNVPTHPAHIVVSVLDCSAGVWKQVKEVNLPFNPKFAGEGLSQSMPISEMETFFKEAVSAQTPHQIELDGIETDCLRVECDREHPVWPNHGECNGGPFNVPFGILHNLRAFGGEVAALVPPTYRPKLARGGFQPHAPEGMALDTRNPLEIIFRGDKMVIGFSLIRPMLTRLAWDHFGACAPQANRLCFTGKGDDSALWGGLNGPSYLTSVGNFVPQNMGGEVEVNGCRVRYRGIETGCGITIDASFTVSAEAVILEIEQEAREDTPVIQGEAWRLLWNMRAGLTGVAAEPVEREGRNGSVCLPALIAADSGGCLAVRLLEGEGAFQTESYRSGSFRQYDSRSVGFVLGRADGADRPLVIPAGRNRAVFELRLSALLPVAAEREEELSDGVRRCWTSGFSAFRPEFGGFSNNSISTNCHVNQHVAADFAAFTEQPDGGPDPLAMIKFSIGRALLDGGGYGYHRSLYLDSDPILLSGAGRVVQISGEQEWLERIDPGIRAAAQRILDNFDEDEGMIVSRTLSGDSGSHRWSSNAMDVIGFGHMDAYVNAWSYRGLRNAAALCMRLGIHSLAARCGQAADALRANFARQLLNPETGRVAGWRSRDGHLHDFAFLWINGVACAFGVMDTETCRSILGKLETLRRDIFPESGYQGLPLNLLPIAPEDHMLNFDLKPTFEHYTDGALSPVFAAYYIRALSIHGLAAEAKAAADRLEHGFADGLFHGPFGTGREFMTWTGADSGYEGTFGPNSGPLYAIAVERGVVIPPNPEWWLA